MIPMLRTFLLGAALAVPMLAACASPMLLTRAAARVTPSVVWFFPTEEKLVALTIDDGPDPADTPRLLDVLREYDASATFFVIGDRVAGNEAILRRMRAEGHELGNHTFRERASVNVATDELAGELDRTHALLAPFGEVSWFRPGSGAFDDDILELAEARGYRTVLGDVFPFDTWIRSSRFHAWYILRNVRPGSVIVLHDARGRGQRTADTLARVLPTLRQRGFRVLSLSALEGRLRSSSDGYARAVRQDPGG